MGAAAAAFALPLLGNGLAKMGGLDPEKDLYEAEKEAHNRNAENAEFAAVDAEARGGIEASKARAAGGEVVGAQRVALAANGVELQSGSALELLVDTRGQSELDAQTLKNNAKREAWGFRTQAVQEQGARKAAYHAYAGKQLGSILSFGQG